MGCSASREDIFVDAQAPRSSTSAEALAQFVATASRRLGHEESVIPCEMSGALHSNCTGPSRGFSSAEAMRQYNAAHLQRICEVGGNILKAWHRLDADFALQRFSIAGSSAPPYRKLQPRVLQAMKKSEAKYRHAFMQLPADARALVAKFEGMWPAASAEELKECCVQPKSASSMRLTYAVGVMRLEPLYQFAAALARYVGAEQKVEWSVKRPWRLWRKGIDSYPQEFAEQDFRHTSDVFRVGVVVETMEQVRQMLEVLEGLGRDAYDPSGVMQNLGLGGMRSNIVVERIKNRFVQPCPGGYMDVIVNLRIDGYVTELQLHLRQLLELKGETGRHMYKWFRAFLRLGSKYQGERAEDGSMHGFGSFNSVTGGRYDGEFRRGLRHGEGMFYYPNGDHYHGHFFEGKRHGGGTFTYASGDRYQGEFANDRMDGHGTYHFVNGERFNGEYAEGKRHGNGTFFYNDGTCLTGEWWYNKRITVESV
eukprot:CAMPEP_0171270574 /NCGR_PEP_ID=MMETSP0790-20130122/60780_1 /TAXON_ID=2925 /ORGANISM="Alexandrium catenella, Strain OF101" /LENGTH=480 /DNA_ID=CAMNT_0011739417 /DNA_START=46 /DNA_END=1488 /DNA_ORIENTATION=+